MSTPTSYISTGPYHDIISGVQLILSFSDGMVCLTGAQSTGKSSLLDALLDALQEDGQLALLLKLPPKTPQELHKHLTRELDLPATMELDQALAHFITARPRDKQHVILLFDDADRMDEETLLAVLQLRAATNNGQTLVSLVLCGLPGLTEQLATPALAALTTDVALTYELNALNLQEMDAFCSAAIQARNLKIPRPAARTLEYLLAETGGLPGAVLQLLPAMVAEPELVSRAATAPPAPILSMQTSPETLVPAPEPAPIAETANARRASLSLPGLQLPFSRTRLRQGLYGSAAIAATIAVAFLLYPKLVPLLQKTESQATTSGPAPAASEVLPIPAIATLAPPEPAIVTPPPASATVSVAATLPVAILQDPTAEALEEVVRNWLAAWQNKDLDGYFGAYHTDFAPLYQGTRAAWREQRSSSITRPSAISMVLDDFSVGSKSVVGTHVSFWLEYHTATYADRTLKELVIGQDLDGRLRILQEINRQVTTLTPSGLLNSADTSTLAKTPTAASGPTAAASATQTPVGPPIQHRASITMDSNAVAASASVSPAQASDLRDFLGSWLNAWQQQDVDSYLRHYHPDFHAQSFSSRSAWEADRTRKITRPLTIQIHLQHLQVVTATPSLGEVELLMEYHSSYYADRTRKTLRLQRSGNSNWQITDEHNLQVDALPLARLIPDSTLTMRGGLTTIVERAL